MASLSLVSFIPSQSFAATLTRELEIGMSGSDVTSLQTFLAADPTLYPQGLITGYFGSLTKAAVTNFQVRNGISAVGRVGPITMAALNGQMNSGVTAGSDNTPPLFSNISVTSTPNTASISWNTNKNAAAVVYYSTDKITVHEASAQTGLVISGTSTVVNVDQRTDHPVVITGLKSRTIYYYVLYVKDISGNENVTIPRTFVTQ